MSVDLIKRCGELGIERDVALGELAIVTKQRDDLLDALKKIANEKIGLVTDKEIAKTASAKAEVKE